MTGSAEYGFKKTEDANFGYGFTAHNLEWYRFIGRIMGRAMYQGILIDVAFAGFFLAKVRAFAAQLHPY